MKFAKGSNAAEIYGKTHISERHRHRYEVNTRYRNRLENAGLRFSGLSPAKEERRGGTVLIASGDRDTFQLASDRSIILYPVRAGEMARIGPAEVRARYGVNPEQVPDFIALRGDPSDKVPGAPGVGATGAATLLQRYGSLEAALKAGRFPAMAETCGSIGRSPP